MHPIIGEMTDVLCRATEADWTVVPPSELGGTVLDLERAQALLDAVKLTVAGEFERSGAWSDDGSRSAKGWISRHGRIAPSSAGRLVRHGRHHRQMPLVAAALAAGQITFDHLAVLGRACSAERAKAFARAEAHLLGEARRLGFEDFVKVVEYWCQIIDDDDAEKKRDKQLDSRALFLSQTADGVRVLDARFDPVGGAIFAQELDRLEQEEFDQDCKQAKARYGEAVTVAHLARTPAQRRLDAAVRMAQRSASLTEGSELARPLVYVHVDWVTFLLELVRAMREGAVPEGDVPPLAGIDPDEVAELVARPMGAGNRPGPRMCELQDGTRVLPSEILPLALRADVRRVVFGPKGNVLDFGRKERLFRGALREAIMVRDRVCQEDGACDRPGHRCQVDHILPWDAHGTTDEANGRLRCGPSNRRRHHTRWRRAA